MTMDILSTAEVAAILNITPGAVRRMRSDGLGPAYVKLGGRTVAYRRTDVEEYLLRRRGKLSTKAS